MLRHRFPGGKGAEAHPLHPAQDGGGLFQEFPEHRVAADRDKDGVEIVIGPQCRLDLRRLQGLFEARIGPGHGGEVLLRQERDGQACGQLVQSRHHLLRAEGRRRVARGHDGRLARQRNHQAGAFQPQQRLADGCPAHAEPRFQFGVLQPFAGLEGAVDDRVTDRVKDVVPQQRPLVDSGERGYGHATYRISLLPFRSPYPTMQYIAYLL